MGFGILNGTSIGLLNLSVGFNSVGFYQRTKLAIIPCTVLLETIFFRKIFSMTIQLSLIILLLGVEIATVTNLQLNMLRSVLSLLAVITTCIAQIVYSCIKYAAYVPCDRKDFPSNLSSLGHLKTCLVLAFGYVLYDPFSWRNIFGILIALVGIVIYSYYFSVESVRKASEVTSQSSQAKDAELDPLISVENGAAVLNDSAVPPVWKSDKGFQA